MTLQEENAELKIKLENLQKNATIVSYMLNAWAEHERIVHLRLPDSDPKCQLAKNREMNYKHLAQLLQS